MKHEFTDKQITTAANKSLFHYGEYNSERGYSWSMTAESLRSFLDALPEPATDDCQEAPFIPVFDVQKGDRVRIDTWQDAHEVTVTEVDPVTIYWEHGHTPKKYVTSVRLLDRPVQHPDPEQHPVILVTEYDVAGNVMECEPTPFFAHDGVYKNDIYAHRPDGVLSWTPGKVVEDDR